jgi:triphosphatase
LVATDRNTEREYKFDVPLDFLVPDLDALVGSAEPLADQRLVTTYFDTPDRRLWQQGVTLRHRWEEGAGDAGRWTLKRPEGAAGDPTLSVRSELSWPGPLGALPPEAESELGGLLGGRPLERLAVLESRRSRWRLSGPGGPQPWAELDDDTVTVTAGPREGLRFRQMEIELLGPAPGAGGVGGPVPGALIDALCRAGAAPGGRSKIALAAGLDPPGPG